MKISRSTAIVDHEWRRKGIGGSDIATIVGVSPFKTATPLALWHYIKQGIKGPESKSMHNGRLLEKAIIDEYQEKEGYDQMEDHIPPQLTDNMYKEFSNQANTIIERHPAFVSDDNPIFRCNLDGWIERSRLIVEAKTTYRLDKSWTKQIPMHYLCQVAWCSAITDASNAVILVRSSEDGYKHNELRKYKRNPKLEQKLQAKALKWWHKHIVNNVPPQPINSFDYENFVDVKTIVANDKLLELLQTEKDIKKDKKELEEFLTTIKEQISEEIAKHTQGKARLIDDQGNVLGQQLIHNTKRLKLNTKQMIEDGVVDKYCLGEEIKSTIYWRGR